MHSDKEHKLLFLFGNNNIGEPLCICSAYFPGDEIGVVPSDTVEKVASNRKWDLLLGCDSNAHHSLWGSRDINEIDEILYLETIFTYVMLVRNVLFGIHEEARFLI